MGHHRFIGNLGLPKLPSLLALPLDLLRHDDADRGLPPLVILVAYALPEAQFLQVALDGALGDVRAVVVVVQELRLPFQLLGPVQALPVVLEATPLGLLELLLPEPVELPPLHGYLVPILFDQVNPRAVDRVVGVPPARDALALELAVLLEHPVLHLHELVVLAGIVPEAVHEVSLAQFVGNRKVDGFGRSPVASGDEEVDPADQRLLFVVDREHFPQFGVLKIVSLFLDNAALDEPQFLLGHVPGVEEVLGGQDGAFDAFGDVLDGFAAEGIQGGALLDDLDVDFFQEGGLEVGGDGGEDFLLLVGVVVLLDEVLVEVVGPDLVLQVVGQRYLLQVAVQLPDLLLVLFLGFGVHLDDLADGVDEIAEGHAADHLDDGDEEAFHVVGRNYLSEAYRREDGRAPVPPDHVFLDVRTVGQVLVAQPRVLDVEVVLHGHQQVQHHRQAVQEHQDLEHQLQQRVYDLALHRNHQQVLHLLDGGAELEPGEDREHPQDHEEGLHGVLAVERGQLQYYHRQRNRVLGHLLAQVDLPDLAQVGHQFGLLVLVLGELEEGDVEEVEEEGDPVDEFVGGNFSEHDFEGALPEVEQVGQDVDELEGQDDLVLTTEEGRFALALRVVLQVLQLVALEGVGVQAPVLCDPLLQVLREQSHVFSFLHHIVKRLFFFLGLVRGPFVAVPLQHILALLAEETLIGVLEHLPERTLVRTHSSIQKQYLCFYPEFTFSSFGQPFRTNQNAKGILPTAWDLKKDILCIISLFLLGAISYKITESELQFFGGVGYLRECWISSGVWDGDNRFLIMMRLTLLLVALSVVLAAPSGDKMGIPPGYPATYNTSVYSGYLDVKNSNRSLHYVFVESVKGAGNKDPVTLWLNGGPGCSSLLGFIQEIGPYYIKDGVDYKVGDNLTENKYSWHLKSNLLFLESPAGVGYSVNNDTNYTHSDATTAYDSLYAVIDFFEKFAELKGRTFFIAGESYAGKYIPDLAVLIDSYNFVGQGSKINLQSIIIGNGVMDHRTITYNSYEYMIARGFVNPEIVPLYSSSCQTDKESAGCRFFEKEFRKGTVELNPYNVYGYCYYNDSFEATSGQGRTNHLSQESILMGIRKEFAANKNFDGHLDYSKFNGAPCSYFDGIYDYFNLNEVAYKAKFPGMQWNGPCASNFKYRTDPEGSMHSYRYLLGLATTERKISIFLYSGTWDSVVPYLDTLKDIKLLNLQESSTHQIWMVDKQHAGFQQVFSGVVFTTVKGASHQVPQSKRPEAFDLFSGIVEGHKAGYDFAQGVAGREWTKSSVI